MKGPEAQREEPEGRRAAMLAASDAALEVDSCFVTESRCVFSTPPESLLETTAWGQPRSGDWRNRLNGDPRACRRPHTRLEGLQAGAGLPTVSGLGHFLWNCG